MYFNALCTIIAFVLGTSAAFAASMTVQQKNKTFSESEVVIKKGETLTFVNNDNITHNIMSKSPGNEFNMGAQAPGVSTPVTFDAAGIADVICAIHPQMRLNVKIND